MLEMWRLQQPSMRVHPKRMRSVSCARKWRPEEIQEEDDVLIGEELKLFHTIKYPRMACKYPMDSIGQ